jgi:menaquinone-9 beta-reductase
LRCATLSGALIIGGGPAGATAAILLARAGCQVTLIERSAGPADKVCGDFVSAEAIEVATACGVDLAALAHSPIDAVRLVHGKQMAEARLPFAALGLTRRALDEALLRQAVLSGATVLRGHAARSMSHDGGRLRIECDSLGPVVADTVFMATGKHDLRGAPRASRGTGMVGLKMYYALDPGQLEAMRRYVELTLFSGGYAGLQSVEGNRAVLCVLVRSASLRKAGGRWDALFDSLTRECPHLAARLVGARPLLDRPLAIAGLPYGYAHAPSSGDRPGLFRLGDQAAVIASLTGDGVALAMASATLAVRIWLDHGNVAMRFHHAWGRRLASQMRAARYVHHACLASAVQPWVLRACRIAPGFLRLAATWTRIPGDVGRAI